MAPEKAAKVRIESSSARPFTATAMFCAVFNWSERRISICPASGGSFSARFEPMPTWLARLVTRLPRFSVTLPPSVETVSPFSSSTETSCSWALRFAPSQRHWAVELFSSCSAPSPATWRNPPAAGPASCLVSPGRMLFSSFSTLTFS